jgi:hypothetical protein
MALSQVSFTHRLTIALFGIQNKAQLDIAAVRAEYKSEFKVPDILIHSYWGSCWRSGQYSVGRIYLSENFLCFKMNPITFRATMKFVIPWKNVTMIEKKGMVLGIVPNALRVTTVTQRQVRQLSSLHEHLQLRH